MVGSALQRFRTAASNRPTGMVPVANRDDRRGEAFFQDAIAEVIPRLLGLREATLSSDARLPDGSRPDFIAEEPAGRNWIIEVKGFTPATQPRIQASIDQLKRYRSAYTQTGRQSREPGMVLIVPGVLSEEHKHQLSSEHIRVIDGPEIMAAMPGPNVVEALHMAGGGTTRPNPLDPGAQLLRKLKALPPGRAEWFAYQATVRDLLEYTLCPPLGKPIFESSNASGHNRRDVILPNYTQSGFWFSMQSKYAADFLVFDAKNYRGPVKKVDILQLANYLSAHGTGLFGAIATRTAEDGGALATRREQWIIHQKMIVILNDRDLAQMVAFVSSGEDPGMVIRQKIEDFRLAL